MPMTRALEAVLATTWGILPDSLEMIRAIAAREHEYGGRLEALEAKLGRPLGNTMKASVRDGIAIVPIEGPLFRRANLMTEFSGATSYDTVATDLTAALEDPSIRAVMLAVDSPGGEMNGASQLAAMIAGASKPVWVHVGGTGASAAYLLSAAATKVIAADTALLGSIGVQIGYTAKDPKAGERTVRFVSSQSPLKNADPETDAGARQTQQMVDDLAAIMIDTIAKDRGVSAEHVLAKFGQGSVMVASKALDAGMIDGIATFESALADLKKEISSMDYASLTAQALAENRADLVAAFRAEGAASVEKVDVEKVRAEAVTAERARITAIEALAMPGAEDAIAKAKADGTDANAAAVLVLNAVRAKSATAGTQHLAGIEKAEKDMDPPKSLQGKGDNPTDEVEAMLALGKSHGVVR